VNCRALCAYSLADDLDSLRCVSGTPFTSSRSCLSSRPSPDPSGPGSFSRVRLSSTESLCRPFRPPLSSRHHAARVSSLYATSPCGVTIPLSRVREIPLSRYVPPSGFLSPSTVYSSARLCGLVASRCHVQGSLRSGVSPGLQPSPSRRRAVPPCRCRPTAHRQAGCHDGTSRLRGFVPQTRCVRPG